MEPPSPEKQQALLPLPSSFPVPKRARFLSLEKGKQRLDQFFDGNKEKTSQSRTDEMERLREKRMIMENLSMLDEESRVPASRLHQRHHLPDDARRLLKGKGVSLPPPGEELSSTSRSGFCSYKDNPGFPNYLRQLKALLMGPNMHPYTVPAAAATNVCILLRTRVDDLAVSDGCKWRNYGQKMTMGNPYPRAYYGCIMNCKCPVTKTVQKCAEDQSILSTTYVGQHNHHLPLAAMPMAEMIMLASKLHLPGPSLPMYMMAGDVASLFCRARTFTYYSAQCTTVVLDMTNPAAYSENPVQRNLHIIAADPAAMTPKVERRPFLLQSPLPWNPSLVAHQNPNSFADEE